jgi:hypothetical protein
MAVIRPNGGPLPPVKVEPQDFHDAAQRFVDSRSDLERIREDLLHGTDAVNGAAGACDGAHQDEDGWAVAMDNIINDAGREWSSTPTAPLIKSAARIREVGHQVA